MIHKKYRIITLLLICILLSNFIFEYKAHAEAIAISAGLALFLKACYAAGITYIGGQAVHKVTKESQQLYKDWLEFIDRQPPDKKPPSNWEKSVLGGLLGAQAFDSVKRLIDSIKDFFDELGAKEGSNQFESGNEVVYVYNSRENIKKTYTVSDSSRPYSFSLYSDGYGVRYVNGSKGSHSYFSDGSSLVHNKYGGSSSVTIEIRFVFNVDNPFADIIVFTGGSVSRRQILLNDEGREKEIPEQKYVNLYFEPGSYQFTNNTNDIRPVYPNFDNLPDGKIVQITDPSGKTSTYYKGSFDDLFNDWIKSQDPNKLFGSKPVTGTITDDGIKIGDDGSELPYPNPNPNPDPQPTPTPEGLGQIIQLLKDLINWTSKIFRKIPEPKPEPSPEPQPEPESLLEKLFKPDTNIKLETDKLKKDRNLSLKFPFSIPWDLTRVVKVFARSPSEPDLKIDIDTEYLKINHTIDLKMITLPIGFFRFAATAFFIFFLASKTRDLIKW